MAVLTDGTRPARSGRRSGADARWRRRVAALVVVCCLGAVMAAAAEGGRSRAATSEEVTAAFIYNLAKFVDWPSEVLPEEADELIIGVLGQESVARALARAVAGKTAQGRRLSVVSFAEPRQVTRVHLLFIGSAQAERLAEIEAALGGRGVFTVGDTPDFVQHGGMVSVLQRQNKMTFEVNIEATRRAGLQISSKLLRLSDAVHGEP